MMAPGHFDILVMRWQPATVAFDFPGYDFSTASAAFQVRVYRDQDGAPLIGLTNTNGIAVSVSHTNGVPTSTVTISISEAAIEALPFSRPRGVDVPFAYDLVIDAGASGKLRWLEGGFTVHAGVTQI